MLFGPVNLLNKLISARIGLPVALSLLFSQPAFAENALWQQYHNCGEQALRRGDCDLATRYLIGALQGAHKANVVPGDTEVQDLLSELSQLSSTYKSKNKYKEANYIDSWLAFSRIHPPAVRTGQAISTGYSSVPFQGAASASDPTDGANNWGPLSSGGSGPSIYLNCDRRHRDDDWDDKQCGDDDCHHRRHRDHDCREEREEIEREFKYLEHSMKELAEGIDKIVNLAK
jgi:hypothetical protein